jgi:dTDP-4-amino-4,6-dideoxygalactose transaminase
MDGLQGAALRVKLDHLEAWNDARRRNARRYGERLRDVRDVVVPTEAPYARHVYHVYAVRIPRRDEVWRDLEAKGISCGVHYPRPLHLQEGYAYLGYREGAFPVAEACARTFLSLPMFAELSEEQISRVGRELEGSLGARGNG